MDEMKTPDPIPHADLRFHLLAGGLLVVILITLAGLWIMERGRRVRIESTMATMRQQLAEQQKKVTAVSQMLIREASTPTVNRRELPTTKVQWNGREKTVLLLGVEIGGRLGFESGDVVQITPPVTAKEPTTQPGGN